MSAHPYCTDPGSSKVLTIRTDFMLMNADGRSAWLRQLVFPKYRDWTITFEGACGRSTRSR